MLRGGINQPGATGTPGSAILLPAGGPVRFQMPREIASNWDKFKEEQDTEVRGGSRKCWCHVMLGEQQR